MQRPRPKWAKKGHFGLNDEHFTTSFVSPNSPYHCTGRIFDLSVLIPSYIVVHMMWWYHCGLTTCLDHLLYYLLEAVYTMIVNRDRGFASWCLKPATLTGTLTLTLTLTLWGDQCLDAVACEGSRLIRPTRMPCLEGRGLFDRLLKRNAVNWRGCGLIAPLMKYPSANQSA